MNERLQPNPSVAHHHLHLAACAVLFATACGADTPGGPTADTQIDVAQDVGVDADASELDIGSDAQDAQDVEDVAPDAPIGPCAEPGPEPTFAIKLVVAATEGDGPPGNAVADIVEADFDGDGHLEYVFAEPALGRLRLLDGCETSCEPEPFVELGELPVRLKTSDLDGDGDLDIIVGVAGSIDSSDERVASVAVVWRDGESWRVETIASELRRVGCIEPIDVDHDGFMDIAVCEFGDINGGVRMLWGSADGFVGDTIYDGPGSIGIAMFDADEDGADDLVVAMSQTQEQVVLLAANGDRTFTPEVLFDSGVAWFGHSSLRAADLDADGRLDVVFTNGDPGDIDTNLIEDDLHGLNVLWNRGAGAFEYERLADLRFAYTTAIGDFDGDCMPDVAVFSLPELAGEEPDPERPALVVRPAVVGEGRVTPLPGVPHNVVGVRAADVDEDGDVDIIGGRFSATGTATGELVFVLDNLAAAR